MSCDGAAAAALGTGFPSRYPLQGMADEQKDVLARSTDVQEAVGTPTAIDAEELASARLDERWREFCLNAERYVAETTRPRTRVGQPA